MNKKNLALIGELFASAFIDHDSSMPEAKSPAGVKRLAAMVHASFPDVHFTIEDMAAEADQVVFRYPIRGTHRNDFMAVAATGKQINATGIRIYRVSDGKLQEQWKNAQYNWDFSDGSNAHHRGPGPMHDYL